MSESKPSSAKEPHTQDRVDPEIEDATEVPGAADQSETPEVAGEGQPQPGGSGGSGGELEAEEIEIFRSELAKAQQELEVANAKADEMKNRYLRARADLENYRRRSAAEVERAREAGLDSAILTVLTVFDDLTRALSVADEKDPGKIIPGVNAVRDGLERNLEMLGITKLGVEGEAFDPECHEALSSMPAEDDSLSGTIAEVYQLGFVRDERLIRPARVVVYQ
ncbi:MAG: nucleotide exchange factor GrpE [Trueperaceae bacterium]|nr:MAG: nucleotide exchange factor GrpE [Trueperaceae bacterium]